MNACRATETPLAKVPNLGSYGAGAPHWLALGIPVFPVDAETKKAKVKNYLKMGLAASEKLAGRADLSGWALGYVGGPGSGLTVVDYDTTDERVVDEAERRFGPTPVKVQTSSGKFHGVYRFTDEGRHVRVFGKDVDAPPIDILGNKSLVVAPPSIRHGRPYRFVEGRLEDLARGLPRLKPGWRNGLAYFANKPARALRTDPSGAVGVVTEGVRNQTLFDALLPVARECPTLELLLNYARGLNATFDPPDDDASVVGTVKSVWTYKQEGRLFTSGNGGSITPHVMLDAFLANTTHRGNSDAVLLYLVLERAHRGSGRPFAISADAMARAMTMGTWNAKQIARARRELVDLGVIEVVHRGGKGPHDPYLYRLCHKAPNLGTNVTNIFPPSSPSSVSREKLYPASPVKRMARASFRAAQRVTGLSETKEIEA